MTPAQKEKRVAKIQARQTVALDINKRLNEHARMLNAVGAWHEKWHGMTLVDRLRWLILGPRKPVTKQE